MMNREHDQADTKGRHGADELHPSDLMKQGFFELEAGRRIGAERRSAIAANQTQRSRVMGVLRVIADHAAWWLLRSLHPRDLGGCETLVVLGSLPRDPSGRETARVGFLPAWFRQERVLVVQRPTLGGLDQTGKSPKRSDHQSFCIPLAGIAQSDPMQSGSGEASSQAVDGFCKPQLITLAHQNKKGAV